MADADAYTILNWAKGLLMDLDQYKHLQAYLQRVATRPAVRETVLVEKRAA